MGKQPEPQATPPVDRFAPSTKERTDWLHLSEQLVRVFQHCAVCVHPTTEADARSRAAQETLEAALKGKAAALALIESTPEEAVSNHAAFVGHPWEVLSRTYAAAFAAAGFIALQSAEYPRKFPALTAELARLAERAAAALAHGTGLLLGTRQSGTIMQICAYVGELEGQADRLLRTFLASPPGRAGDKTRQSDPRTYGDARQILRALEAMTDRCEDIADALLAVAHDHQEGEHVARPPTSTMLGEPHER